MLHMRRNRFKNVTSGRVGIKSSTLIELQHPRGLKKFLAIDMNKNAIGITEISNSVTYLFIDSI
jgi:hypothetical protein